MGGINFRKRGSKWEYRFDSARVNDKRVQITKGGFKTKKEAIQEGTKALNEYNNSGLHFVPSEVSFNDYLDYWMKNYCEVNLKKTTCHAYEKKIRLYIKPELGHYKLKALSPSVLQEFINKKFNEGFSRNSLMTFKGILSGSIGYAIYPSNFIQNNPLQHVKIPSPRAESIIPTRNKLRRAATKDEIVEIFKRFPENHPSHIPLQFAYRCGMRLGEAFAITWNDVNLNNATIDINKQVQNTDGIWTFSNPKYDSFRIIKIDSHLLILLQQENKRQIKSEEYYGETFTNYYKNKKNQIIIDTELNITEKINFVCRRENGTYIQPRTMQHCSHVIHYELNNMDFDFHSLRHTHVTMLIEAGANPKDVQYRLGHKNIEVTLGIYAELTEKMKNRSIEIIENIF